MSTATSPAPAETAEREQCIVLFPVSWQQYETVLQALPEQAGLRITYLDGRLTLLSPIARRHDWHEAVLGRLVEEVAYGLGLECEPAGHTTYRQEGVRGGVEGDKTFYLGEHAAIMRGPVDVDLSTQPPPDLAIEVEATHRADDSVEVWGRLRVPEVWRLDVERWTLTFGLRQDDGTYRPAPRSAALPVLEPGDVLDQLRMAAQLGWSQWRAQLDDWVRNVLLPRRGA